MTDSLVVVAFVNRDCSQQSICIAPVRSLWVMCHKIAHERMTVLWK